MNIVIVSVLLSIAVIVLVPIGFVFGGLWGRASGRVHLAVDPLGAVWGQGEVGESRDTARADYSGQGRTGASVR